MIQASRFDWRMIDLLQRAAACIGLSMLALTAAAQQRNPLTQGEDVIAVPGIGRVILVFSVVALLAVAIVFALKRLVPKVAGGLLPGGNLRVVERINLGAGLRVHVLEVDGERILLAEKRNAMALAVLEKSKHTANRDRNVPA